MKYIHSAIVFSLLLFVVGPLLAQTPPAQRSDPTLRRIGYHTGNKIAISFYNDGAISGFNTGVDIRGEWPRGSKNYYIGDVTPMVGVEIVNQYNDSLHPVVISRGPRTAQAEERSNIDGHFWGWNPRPGYLNPNQVSVAMSHIDTSWPVEGWIDHPDWKTPKGVTQWNGYFGRGIMNADQESYFVADDNADDEFNNVRGFFRPDTTDTSRHGMGFVMKVRGFQWSSFLAEDCLFWLYDITNEGTTLYRKSVFGMVVGGCVGGDGDCGDDLGFFDVNDNITYTWDSDNKGNKGQKMGYAGYAFLESPGNPYDGIDNDGDSPDPNSPVFDTTKFRPVTYNIGDKVVLIDPLTYERTLHTISAAVETVYSMGVRFILRAGVTSLREGHIASVQDGQNIPDLTAYDGFDNDLDGLVDENQSVVVNARVNRGLPAVKYKNYVTGAGVDDPLIDERRDNEAGTMILSWVRLVDGTTTQISHWSGDEDGDWDPAVDDVGSDGVGPNDENYYGADADGSEGNGKPDQGEPNFGRTDPDESDQIGLTSFNFFNQTASPRMNEDEVLWSRMRPGRFDVVPQRPQDGDFIYATGYFPMKAKQVERFSLALLFGENYADILKNKRIVQQIYNAGYKFPQPPRKPKITITERNGKVVIYWDGTLTENSRDFITKKKDFEGYKIYRATDAGFLDSRVITDAKGILAFDAPIAQYDLKDSIQGYFYPSASLLDQVGGTTFWLGDSTGIVNEFVDSTVVAGQRYYYAVCAYDHGEPDLNIFPSENSKFVFQTTTGQIVTDDNTGYITPGVPPVGYVAALPSNLDKSNPFIGTGTAWVRVVDEQRVKDGNEYKIVFADTGIQRYTTDWSLLDMTAPDTVMINATGEIKYPRPGDTITVPYNDSITVNGNVVWSTDSVFSPSPDTLINREKRFYENTPIVHGLNVQMVNNAVIKVDTNKTGFDMEMPSNYDLFLVDVFPWNSDARDNGIESPSDYQFEFFNTIVDTSVADTLRPPIPTNRVPATPVKFKVKNLSTGQYIDFVYRKNTTANSVNYVVYFKEKFGAVVKRTWRVIFYYNDTRGELPTTGHFNLYFFKPFISTDFYTFTIHGSYIDKPKASRELDRIKVVPNPYVVTHQLEPALATGKTSGRGDRFVRFTHVPPGSTISIFTVRGSLVKKLYHDGLYNGDVYWYLRTEENLDVAYGVYVYVVETPDMGTKTGKLALIK